VETLSAYLDQRVRVASVSAESTLTRDTLPVNVDAIVFWMVWNAEKCILEVENFMEAINMSAQAALRESHVPASPGRTRGQGRRQSAVRERGESSGCRAQCRHCARDSPNGSTKDNTGGNKGLAARH
jgi:hypothetical protein